MQFSSITILLAALATGALAVPGHSPPPPPKKPVKPNPPSINNNYQKIECGNNAAPYCCSATIDGKNSDYTCKNFQNVCNAITVCCQNNVAQGGQGKQTCSAFGSAKVIYEN